VCRYFAAATANATTNGVGLIGHFNNFAYHSIAISLSMVDNAILRYATPNYRIETINHPLPRSANTKANDAATDAMGLAFTFVDMVRICCGRVRKFDSNSVMGASVWP